MNIYRIMLLTSIIHVVILFPNNQEQEHINHSSSKIQQNTILLEGQGQGTQLYCVKNYELTEC